MQEMLPNVGVHSFDEWTRLRQVIVGHAEGYRRHHLDTSFALFFFENLYEPLSHLIGDDQFAEIPEWILTELEEDIEDFVAAIEDFGAIVLRPADAVRQSELVTPLWSSISTPPLNVRDQTIILGTTIVETAPHVRGRISENDYLKPIFYRYFAAGSSWISMPRPCLGEGSLDPSYFLDAGLAVEGALEADSADRLPGLGHELVFDGAQCIRLGTDVLVNVANENHELGFTWLTRTLGDEFRFHRIYRLADNHIDSIILPLRPGVLLLRSPKYLAYLPTALQGWDVIFAPPIDEARFPAYGGNLLRLASKYVDMNVLSLDENTVIVNSLYPELIEALESRGFDVVPVRHRHRRLFGGGFHCFTLDCLRDGGPESYLKI
jgi:glycine amidinotransferase